MGISLTGLNSGLADTYSALLGSANTNNSDVFGSSTLLSDYASIKNGSYGKMLKAYYAKTTAEKTGSSSSSKAAKKTEEKDSASASAASTAYKSAEKLKNTEFSEDNMDEAYNAVSDFVNNYNEMMKSASKSSIESVQRQADYLNDAMYTNYKLFAQAGITLNDDRTLSINESVFKKGNVATLKTLFNGMGSFADKVSAKASQIYRNANGGKAMSAKNYTNNGTYNKTVENTTIDSTT